MDTLTRLEANIARVIKDQPAAVRLTLCALIGGGHILLEDYPGTGKTTLAKAIARSVDADYRRVQFTPDLLPSDIIGVSIFDQRSQHFEFHRGPIFTNILLADEINRASPRTQSALLEAMAEAQVSHDGASYPLDELFFVIATQNPVEFRGTYPLPEAQMDRFALRLKLGYLRPEQEVSILDARQQTDPLTELAPCCTPAEILALREAASEVAIGAELKRYIVDIVAATRVATGVQMGASPRASLTLMKLSQILALSEGLDYVTPDHVQALAVPVVAHRLALSEEGRFAGVLEGQIVEQVLETLRAPH